jgi:MFS family permease
MYRLFKLDMGLPAHRSAWHLIIEMFWASMLAAAAVFNAAFAIRLGATNTQISLLTSVPALIAVLVSLPAGWFLQKRPRRKPWLLWSLGFHRFGFLLVILVPLLPDTWLSPGLLLVLILVMISIPAHFFNVGFIPMLSEVIPENLRAAVFSARNIFYNAVLSVCGVLFGFWLDWAAFPWNYQVLYLFGFACSMLSIYSLNKVDVPDSPPAPAKEAGNKALTARWQEFRQALTNKPGFLRITINTVLHGFGVWMALPLYVLYFLRQLEASEGWLGINGTVASLATILGYTIWRRIIQRQGEPDILRLTIVCVGLYPIFVGLVKSLPLILLGTALNGLLVPGVNLSHFNTLLRVTPPDERPSYTALYMTAANIGAFVCPLLGVAFANLIGLAPALIFCGALSMIGSTSFWFWPVEKSTRTLPSADG